MNHYEENQTFLPNSEKLSIQQVGKKNQEPVDKQLILNENLFSICFNTVCSYFFFQYTFNEEKYGGDGCEYLLICARFILFYCLTFLCIRLLINIPLLLSEPENELKDWKKIYYKVIEVTETYIGLFLVIALTALLFKKEECGSLRSLSILYVTTIYVIFFGIFCCWVCSIFLSENEKTQGKRKN